MENKTKMRSDCPICQSLDVFGDKWSLLIVRDLMLYDKHAYGDFLKMEEGIATNILADRLVSLETAGIILKENNAGSKSKYFYKLTKKGIDLAPLALELIIWADKYYEIKPFLKQLIPIAKMNKEKFVEDLAVKSGVHSGKI